MAEDKYSEIYEKADKALNVIREFNETEITEAGQVEELQEVLSEARKYVDQAKELVTTSPQTKSLLIAFVSILKKILLLFHDIYMTIFNR